MAELLGQRFLRQDRITEDQLAKALERQRRHGGRLGENLVALGFAAPDDVEDFFKRTPLPVKTIADSGLSLSFLRDLILKHALHMVEFSIPELSSRIKLPPTIIDAAVEDLRKEQMAEAKSAGSLSKLTYRFALTDRGRREAGLLMEQCRYAGPAPVSFQDYRTMVLAQTIKSIIVREETVREAFSHLVIGEDLLNRVGPAVSSGKSIFLYGPPGNGKTTIAETIGNILPGEIFVPYAVLIDSEIITLYDPMTHRATGEKGTDQDWDQRWVKV
ncbi:MAG: ATPase, partial [Desulfobacteraceae bacterium]|nr:ATPase [Desulfobacteraceae bacterium]